MRNTKYAIFLKFPFLEIMQKKKRKKTFDYFISEHAIAQKQEY